MHLVRQGLQLVFIASTSADLKNARALSVGLCATLFRPTDSARTDRTQSKTSFPPLEKPMQQGAPQLQQDDPADGVAQNAHPAAAVGTRPPQPRTAPPTETAPPAAARPAPTPTPQPAVSSRRRCDSVGVRTGTRTTGCPRRRRRPTPGRGRRPPGRRRAATSAWARGRPRRSPTPRASPTCIEPAPYRTCPTASRSASSSRSS